MRRRKKPARRRICCQQEVEDEKADVDAGRDGGHGAVGSAGRDGAGGSPDGADWPAAVLYGPSQRGAVLHHGVYRNRRGISGGTPDRSGAAAAGHDGGGTAHRRCHRKSGTGDVNVSEMCELSAGQRDAAAGECLPKVIILRFILQIYQKFQYIKTFDAKKSSQSSDKQLREGEVLTI